MKAQLVISVVLAAGLLSGCVAPSTKVDLKKKQIEATDRTGKAIYGVGRGIIAGDTTVIDPYEAGHDQATAQAMREIDAIRQRLLAQEKALNEFLNTAIDAAGAAVPGGGIGANVAKNLLNRFKMVNDVAATAANDATAAKTDAAGATNRIANLDSQIKSTNQQLDDTRKAFAKLDTDTQSKLGEISKDQLARLESLRNDRAKFEEEFRKELSELGLTTAQIKGLEEKTKGLSTEQIIGLLVAAGAGGALGKTGKSRAQPEIEKLKDKIGEIDKQIVKHG
jgi:hypothetical protein